MSEVQVSTHSPKQDSSYIGTLPFEQRDAVLHLMAKKAGIRMSRTFLPSGTSLLPVGEENQRRLEAHIDSYPEVGPALAALRHRIIDIEQPVDTEVPISEVRMEPETGGLYGTSQGPASSLAYTDSGFSHVTQFIKPPTVRAGFKDTLLALPNGLRSDVFNYCAQTAHRQATEMAVFRTIRDEQRARRIIRAVASARHSLETGDDLAVADALERSDLPAGARARITRELDRSYFELTWPALKRELRVGDIAQISALITNSETKESSLEVHAQILQIKCWNFTTAWARDDEEPISIRHVGDLQTKLPAAFRRALDRVEPFVLAFADAYRQPLPANAQTRGEVLSRVGKALELPQTVLDGAQQLWDLSGAGDTLAGLVNALTRKAQDLNMEQGTRIERQAGRLIAHGWAALN